MHVTPNSPGQNQLGFKDEDTRTREAKTLRTREAKALGGAPTTAEGMETWNQSGQGCRRAALGVLSTHLPCESSCLHCVCEDIRMLLNSQKEHTIPHRHLESSLHSQNSSLLMVNNPSSKTLLLHRSIPHPFPSPLHSGFS